MNLNAFELYLISNDNPAKSLHAIARVAKGDGPSTQDFYDCVPKPWAVIFLADYYWQDGYPLKITPTIWEEAFLTDVGKWALIESLNTGSYQCEELPDTISNYLLGSGRWHANDCGGWSDLLRTAVVDWLQLTFENRQKWELLAKWLKIDRSVLSILKPEAEKIRAEKKGVEPSHVVGKTKLDELEYLVDRINSLSTFDGMRLPTDLETLYDGLTDEERCSVDNNLIFQITTGCDDYCQCDNGHDVHCNGCTHYKGWVVKTKKK